MSWSLLKFKWKWSKIIYTNFEFYEMKIHEHLENIWIYKAKQFMSQKEISNNVHVFSKTVQVLNN
jgi:hypothetical protein